MEYIVKKLKENIELWGFDGIMVVVYTCIDGEVMDTGIRGCQSS